MIKTLKYLARRFFRTPISYSLNDLDVKLLPYLDFTEGFFVEAGANDGISQSNTFYFEKYRNWSGLLVEPIPELAKKCRLNRPECRVFQAALVAPTYAEATVSMSYCNLMSLVKGAMKSPQADARHLEAGEKVQNVTRYEVTVPARTLTSLLDEAGAPKVDFLSLDVEGYELQALQGLDLEKYRPKFILVEARFRDEIDAYLMPWYEAVAELSHHDVLYRRYPTK